MQDLTVSVAEILGRPGHFRDTELHEPLLGVRNALARLTEAPVVGRLRAESVVEGILITGRVTGSATLECARCLREFEGPVELQLCELFATPEHRHAEDDAYDVTGTDVRLEPMLRDALALALPLNPVCDPDCKGLCAVCGRDLNYGTCECRIEEADPRWAPLAALRQKLEG